MCPCYFGQSNTDITGWIALRKLDSILRSRDITFLIGVSMVKTMIFPVVLYGCESWTIKKAEHWKINAFELRYWGRLLKVPWTARRSSQLILKEISHEYSLEGLILEAPIIWPPDEKSLLTGKDLDPEKDWRQEKKQMTEDEMVGWHHQLKDMSLNKFQEIV